MYIIYIKNPIDTSDESKGFTKELLYSPTLYRAIIYNGLLTTELNKAGSFEFTIPPTHSCYDKLRKLVTLIEIYKNGEIYWRGRVLNIRRGITKDKIVICEGSLAFFNDIKILYTARSNYNSRDISGEAGTLPGRYKSAIRSYTDSCNNGNRNWYRRLHPGNCNLVIRMDEFTNINNISVCDSENEYLSTTLDRLNRFIRQFDGYLFARYDGDDTYIDFTNELTLECSQTIEFGKNLIDLDEFIDGTKVCTGLWVRGVVDESLRGLSGSGVDIDPDGNYTCHLHLPIDQNDNQFGYRNNNRFGYTMFNEYGLIDQNIDNMDIGAVGNVASVRSNINAYAISEFNNRVKQSLSITMSAIDLSMLDVDTEEFEVGKLIPVISKPHGINEKLICSKIVIDLTNPENNQYVFGTEDESLTGKIYGN